MAGGAQAKEVLMPEHNLHPINVMIMAGGTGGHVIPALSVAESLRDSGASVEWLGTRAGIEAHLVPAAGIRLHTMAIEGVRGRGLVTLLKAPLLLFNAVRLARRQLRASGTQVVLGMGGFASGPGAIAARTLNIPVVLHEQNAVAGTTNKIVAKFARCVLLGFPEALRGGKWVGNPVRAQIEEIASPNQRLGQRDGRPRLLILGGSRGALALNQLLPRALALLPPEERPEVWHQTGAAHCDATRLRYVELGVEAKIEPFIDDMARAYRWSDFAICRAGALTVAELTAAGVGAILVPFPYAIDDHQTRNAELLVKEGAALLFQQRDLTAQRLAEQLRTLTSSGEHRLGMALRARALAKQGSAQAVAKICCEVANAD